MSDDFFGPTWPASNRHLCELTGIYPVYISAHESLEQARTLNGFDSA